MATSAIRSPETTRTPRTLLACVAVAAVLVTLALVASQYSTEPLYQVEGNVVVGGRPVAGVWLRFHADPSSTRAISWARTDDDGRFVARHGLFQTGLPSGEYRVTAEWRPLVALGEHYGPGRNVLLATYQRVEDTPLRVRVGTRPRPAVQWQLARCDCGG